NLVKEMTKNASRFLSLANWYSREYSKKIEEKSDDKETDKKKPPFISVANRIYAFTRLESAYQDLFKDIVVNELNDKSLDSTERAKRVNAWVSSQTKGKITEIVTPGIMQPQLKLLIINCIYFQAMFETPFKAQNTQSDVTFYTNYKREKVVSAKVKMMSQQSHLLQYIEEYNGYELVMLKYAMSNFRLILARPTKDDLQHLKFFFIF
ncbi:hypothetical protein RFI_02317, partial [Reticulomyxa filosa]